MNRLKICLAGLAISMSCVASAESEFSVYGGTQSSPHSTVYNTSSTPPSDTSLYTGWKASPLSFPIYAGWRYTNWSDNDWGYAINYSHTKAISLDQASAGYSRLEFTDGANPFTLILLKRFSYRAVKPHVGAGLGFSVPHVEAQWTTTSNTTSAKTYEYQYGGPVATLLAGFSYPINDKWNLLTEFQMHYMKLDVAVDGGRLKTNLITNALNLGVSYRF